MPDEDPTFFEKERDRLAVEIAGVRLGFYPECAVN